jgi:hypothetical protein
MLMRVCQDLTGKSHDERAHRTRAGVPLGPPRTNPGCQARPYAVGLLIVRPAVRTSN